MTPRAPSSTALHEAIARRVLHEATGRTGPESVPKGEAGHAAVLALFRLRGGRTEILMIQRAERADDPWSGHIALPGGRWSPQDADLRATAIRESVEEVGLHAQDLEEAPVFFEFRAPVNRPGLKVGVFLAVQRDDAVGPSGPGDEVAAMFWAPVRSFRPSEVTIEIPGEGGSFQTPALLFTNKVVWGFTRKVFLGLMERLGEDLP